MSQFISMWPESPEMRLKDVSAWLCCLSSSFYLPLLSISCHWCRLCLCLLLLPPPSSNLLPSPAHWYFGIWALSGGDEI